MAKPNEKLTSTERAQILNKLTQGAAYRARTLSLVFGVGFFLFGFTSYKNIARFDPGITFFNNIWPRVLFNSLPFFLIAFLLHRYWKTHAQRVIWAWNIGFPSVFIAACNIHVWPTILKGHPTLYLYAHGANIIVLLMAFIMVAQPPRQLAVTVGILILGFVGPLSYIFLKIGDAETLNFLLNDFGFAFILGLIAANMNYKLRFRLAHEDLKNKQRVEKFVGKKVTESVFENNNDLLKPHITQAFVMVLDFRGFTSLARSGNDEEKKKFMSEYHKLVANVTNKYGGYIHKTAGDGYIISFGLMDVVQVDLSDIPGLEEEEARAKERKNRDLGQNALKGFKELALEFKKLQLRFVSARHLIVGAALDFGEIECKLIGDANVRLEFDIDGLTVIRGARLESYTKYLITKYEVTTSLIALSETAAMFIDDLSSLRKHSTSENPVRDFPEIKNIFFLAMKEEEEAKDKLKRAA